MKQSIKKAPNGVLTEQNKSKYTDTIIKALTIVVLLALWEILARQGVIKVYLFSKPSDLGLTIWKLINVGYPKGVTVIMHVSSTVKRILIGYILATAGAIPLGIIIGKFHLFERAVNPIITFSRAVAVISLLPLAIAWFGVGELARVLLITWGCFWAMITNTIQGVKNIDCQLIETAHVLGIKDRQIFFRVFLPATLPRIFAGMKVALGVAFMVIIAVEMLGAESGLGALIGEARYYYNPHVALAGMFFIAVFGLTISIILDVLERILLPWARGLEEVER